MRDLELEHYEWRSGCNEDGFDELEPEDVVLDRLDQMLAAAYSVYLVNVREGR